MQAMKCAKVALALSLLAVIHASTLNETERGRILGNERSRALEASGRMIVNSKIKIASGFDFFLLFSECCDWSEALESHQVIAGRFEQFDPLAEEVVRLGHAHFF